jgi:hypothetical protein
MSPEPLNRDTKPTGDPDSRPNGVVPLVAAVAVLRLAERAGLLEALRAVRR